MSPQSVRDAGNVGDLSWEAAGAGLKWPQKEVMCDAGGQGYNRVVQDYLSSCLGYRPENHRNLCLPYWNLTLSFPFEVQCLQWPTVKTLPLVSRETLNI